MTTINAPTETTPSPASSNDDKVKARMFAVTFLVIFSSISYLMYLAWTSIKIGDKVMYTYGNNVKVEALLVETPTLFGGGFKIRLPDQRTIGVVPSELSRIN